MTKLLLPFVFMPFFAFAQSADEIMSSVRQVAILQNEQTLEGQIRKQRLKIPMVMFLRGKDIQFKLDGGKQGFHLRLNDDGQQLFEIVDGEALPLPHERIGVSIAGTDVSYEDLALKFLYWKNPRIVDEQKIDGQQCWRLHVNNPDQTGQYREISVWVTKRERALMRVVGYGERPDQGLPPALKQFEITKIMKVEDTYTIGTMKVSTFGPDNRVKGITYLEFEKPKRRL